MPKLRRISGKNLVKLLLAEGFSEVRQKGSHIRMVMKVASITYYLTIPLHEELDRGTLKSIMRSLERCFSADILKKIFYTK
ncbi:MAG: type II toxin-antitoxin system HicA family toxin [Candidatus Taylorbacteria bacterium]|nr:type II toxin-antitoxin system HicA family toxin [Candidatus Taylorbacteria bacterium]